MRHPLLVFLLILLALIPILIWGYAAYGLAISYQASEAGARKAGQAVAILLMVVLALTPALIGGILMMVGAALLRRKPLGSRIMATLGIAIVVLTLAVALAFEGSAAHYSMVVTAIAYALLHLGLVVWMWRDWRGATL